MSRCTFTNNFAVSDGGGIYNYKTMHMTDCTVAGNVSDDSGGIGNYDDLYMSQCLLRDNSVGDYGGGIYNDEYGYLYLTNCTIAGNAAGDGGGVYNDDEAYAYNSIVYGNTDLGGFPNNYYDVDFEYGCTTPDPGYGSGNITNDPQFVDASSDNYRLSPNSPCIDAGNNSYMPSGADRDGVPRPLDGDADGTATVDMGCYEFLNAAADSDGDPMTDGEEFIADTDPTDSNDYFRITAISNGPPSTVYFDSSSSRWYTMVGCSNLIDAVWTNVPGAGPRVGAGGGDWLQDTNVPAKGPFYRLEVARP